MVKKRPAVKKSVKVKSKAKARPKVKAKKVQKVKAKKRVVAKKVTKPKKKLKAKPVKKLVKKKVKAKKPAKKITPKAKPKKLKPLKKPSNKKPSTKNIKQKTLGTKTKMQTSVSKSTAAQPSKAINLKEIKSSAKSTKNYMTPKNLATFRAALLKWKQDLMAGVDKTIHHMQDEAANFADPNDRATQEEEFSLELRTRDRERKLMTKIDEALERIDAGDYGFCEECGIEIGLERLRARPTATLCIDCKTLDEIREKQIAN